MTTNSQEELTERFVESVELLNRRLLITRISGWHALRLTIPQARTLFLLEDRGPMRMGVIARALDIAVSATTTVVDRLVDRGFAERLAEPGDRRVVVCRLTKKGEKAARNFWLSGTDHIRALADHLEDDHLAGLLAATEALHEAEAEAEAEAAADL